MNKSWKKLKAFKKVLSISYQKNILDYLLHKKKGHKQCNDIVHRFVLAYLEGLNIRYELNIGELIGIKHRTKIRFP